MDLEHRAAELIEQAEKGIAALATEAAAQRDYQRASLLMALAQRVAEAPRAAGLTSSVAAFNSRPFESGVAAPAPRAQGNGAAATTMAAPPPTAATPRSAPGAPAGHKAGDRRYPHFKREGNTLVKVGWSKSDRATYEHRSPRDVVDRLVAAVRRAGAAGDRFTTEELMPLRDDAGNELPSYQAYLCLAWLVTEGLLERHGRQGYTLPNGPAHLEQAVEAKWQALSKR